MTKRIEQHGLQIADELYDFIVSKALPGTGVDADVFWQTAILTGDERKQL